MKTPEERRKSIEKYLNTLTPRQQENIVMNATSRAAKGLLNASK